jgi:hypothetical protein
MPSGGALDCRLGFEIDDRSQRLRDAQQARVRETRTDDLDADRQSLGANRAGDREAGHMQQRPHGVEDMISGRLQTLRGFAG